MPRMRHFVASLPKWVLTAPKETSAHIFKMVIFPKFFWPFMKHIIRWYTGKEIKLFPELFSNTIFEYSFVCFFMHNTIHILSQWPRTDLKKKVLAQTKDDHSMNAYKPQRSKTARLKIPHIGSQYINFSKADFYQYKSSFTVITFKLVLLSKKRFPLRRILILPDIKPTGLSCCDSIWSG